MSGNRILVKFIKSKLTKIHKHFAALEGLPVSSLSFLFQICAVPGEACKRTESVKSSVRVCIKNSIKQNISRRRIQRRILRPASRRT